MLSSRTFAFTHTSPTKSGSIHVFSFDLQSPPRLTGKFGLPIVNQNATIRSMTIHTGPFCANLPTKDLFASDWQRHIVVLELDYLTTDLLFDCSFLLCLRNDTILHRLSPTMLDDTSEELSWLQWGSGRALLYPVDSRHAYRWMRYILFGPTHPCMTALIISPPNRYVHGQRVILPYEEDATEVSVLDFSQGAVHTDWSSIDTPLVTSYTVPGSGETASVGYSGPLFAEDFIEGIPYRKTTRQLPGVPWGYAGFMIDETRILALEVSENLLVRTIMVNYP